MRYALLLACLCLLTPTTSRADEPTPEVKKQRVVELKKQIEESTRELCLLTLNKNVDIRRESLSALEHARPDLHKYLAPFILDQREKVRFNAAEGLIGLGKAAAPALGVLVAKVYDSSLKIPDKTDLGFTEMDRVIYPVLKSLKPEHPEDIKILMLIAAPDTFSGVHRGQALYFTRPGARRRRTPGS